MPKTAWITYSWADNKSNDVDFAVQELQGSGIVMKLDRWSITAGSRLWDQIAKFITDPKECDAWILYATQNSLLSEPCREELAYALDRALRDRGDEFPVIGLFPGSIDTDLVPAAIRTRLYVSLTDVDWKERVKAAIEGRALNTKRITVEPYEITTHAFPDGAVIYEVRPRAGTWAPPIVAVPIAEQEQVKLNMCLGPRNRPPLNFIVSNGVRRGPTPDGRWFFHSVWGEATPTMSIFIFCKAKPSHILFGPDGGSCYCVPV